MKNVDLAKVVFNCTGIFLVFACGTLFGAFDMTPRTTLYSVRNSIAQVYFEGKTLAGIKPQHFLQPARYRGDGVTVNEVPSSRNELVLMSGFFDNGNALRLLRRDGTIAARWPVRFSEIFPDTGHITEPPSTDWNVDIHGALIEPDGSVVFNFEYAGLIKLDRCGDVVWTLPRMTHHSVERAEGGGYWVPGRRYHDGNERSPFPPYRAPFAEDTLLKVSEDGKVVSEVSVPQIFYDNNLEALLTTSGHSFNSGMLWDREILHLNKIEELTADIADDFPVFGAGDLALSIRQSNLVLVFDPDTGKVKWWHVGPWLRQHDPEFRSGGTLVVFNNNVYRNTYSTPPLQYPASLSRASNIMEIDPASGEHAIIYGDRADQKMLTVVRGKVELTPHDGLLVTEFESGRAFETDAEGNVIWEYINRYNAEEVAEITEARAYPESYFTVQSWSCDGPRP